MNTQPFRSLLQNRNFLLLWASQMLSQFTIQLMSYFILTRIFEHTQSTIAVSLIWIAGSLPSIIFGPFSGPIVDRFSRRKLMLIMNILQAVTVFFTIFITTNIFPFYIVAFTYWFLDLLYYPSQQASAPALVTKDELPAANGLFLVTQQISVIVGFVIGGILLSSIGPTGTVLIASVNLILAAIAVYYLPKDEPTDDPNSKNVFDFWKELHEGYDYLRLHRVILLPLLLIISTQILISIISTSAPTYTDQILQLALSQASIYLIVPGTLGALAVTYYLPHYGAKYRKKQFIETGLFVASVAMLSLGFLGTIKFPLLRSLSAAIVTGALGASLALIIIPAQSLLQENTPAWLLGRVYGQMGFLLNLATLLPLLFAATVTDTIGISAMMSIIGVIVLLSYLLVQAKGDHVLHNGFRL